MPSVLFVCTGNYFRSPLAAAYFLKRLKDSGLSNDWIVESAGTWTSPGQPFPHETLRITRGLGVEVRPNRTQAVSAKLLGRFDLIVVMEQGHKEALKTEFPFVQDRLHLLSEILDQQTYDIPDPARTGQPISDLASELFMLMERGFESLYRMGKSAHPGET